MKHIQKTLAYLTATITCFLFSLYVLAQEEGTGGTKIDVDINKESGDWYTQPWVWIVGAALFILLLVALLRGNNRSSD